MNFTQIAFLLVAAAISGIVAKALKQPLILGYLLAGLLLSSLGFVGDIEVFSGLGQIGVALLLFLVGLEMNLKELPSIGKVALITGLGQIIFTSGIGFFLSLVLGFSVIASVYISIALTFSSTIIIVKLLSEKKDLDSLYGKISIGFLLVQDFVAILILVYLAGLGRGPLGAFDYVFIGVKAIALFFTVWVLSKKILPFLFDKYLAKSQELLFISSIAWALGVASFVAGPVGFTYEIGGFLAGIALSNLPEHLQIASRTRPVRDFFLTIFFLGLGTKLAIGNISEIAFPAAIFSVFVLIGNPLIVLSLLGALGYKKRTSFLAGLTVAQISEFSLIIMAMGAFLGHVSDTDVAIVVLVGVVTMTASTYLILGAEKVFKSLKGFLTLFEKRVTKEDSLVASDDFQDHIVLVGAGRTGHSLTKYLAKKSTSILVVDFNPKVFTNYVAEKIPVLFGDINDPEIQEIAKIDKAKMIISTISNLSDNLSLLEDIKRTKNKPVTIFTALTKDEALKYYEKGVDKAIVPQTVAGDHIRHILRTYGIASKKINRLGKSHFERLIRY